MHSSTTNIRIYGNIPEVSRKILGNSGCFSENSFSGNSLHPTASVHPPTHYPPISLYNIHLLKISVLNFQITKFYWISSDFYWIFNLGTFLGETVDYILTQFSLWIWISYLHWLDYHYQVESSSKKQKSLPMTNLVDEEHTNQNTRIK